jgi:hypothetical protein
MLPNVAFSSSGNNLVTANGLQSARMGKHLQMSRIGNQSNSTKSKHLQSSLLSDTENIL